MTGPIDLRTDYLGLALRNPLVASPSPLSHTVGGVRLMAAGGVGAIVLHSLFEEQLREEAVRNSELVDSFSESFGEALGYFPSVAAQDDGPRRYLELLERSVAAVDVPVIASLNGASPGGWSHYARALEDAGAAAIELNVYLVPSDPFVPGGEVERRHVEIVERVREAVTIPVAVKIGPQLSSVGELAERLADAGANGLVLFNRFLVPDVEPEKLQIVGRVSDSRPEDGRLARTWIALLHGRVDLSLAATGGVERSGDVAAHLLAGADVVMTTSALLRHGPDYAHELLDGLEGWLTRRGLTTVADARGLLAAARLHDDGVRRGRLGYVAAMRAANAGVYAPWS